MQFLTKNQLLGISFSGMIGFIRGMNQYDYEYNEYNKYKKDYLYTNKIGTGLIGTFIYINPAFFPIVVYKEFYRLEINLRGLEDEKNSYFYNKIFI